MFPAIAFPWQERMGWEVSFSTLTAFCELMWERGAFWSFFGGGSESEL